MSSSRKGRGEARGMILAHALTLKSGNRPRVAPRSQRDRGAKPFQVGIREALPVDCFAIAAGLSAFDIGVTKATVEGWAPSWSSTVGRGGS